METLGRQAFLDMGGAGVAASHALPLGLHGLSLFIFPLLFNR